MPAIALYLPLTIALIALWRRYVQPMSVAAAIVLIALPLCFTGKAMLTGRVYAPIDLPFWSEPLENYAEEYGVKEKHNATLSDLYMQMMPWQRAVRDAYARGEFPLWNPTMLSGTILAANMQSAVYDPLQSAGLLLKQPQAHTFGAAMTFFLAALFTFGFARAHGLREVPALIASAGYMYSQICAYFVGWPLGRAWALFPFVLLGVRFVVRETSVRAAVLLTTAFAYLVVAGHPESLFHIVLAGLVYGIAEVLVTRRYKSIALAALCGVIALLLTAVVLLPFAAVTPHTAEYATRHGYYAKNPLPVEPGTVERRAGLSLFPWYGGIPEEDNHTNDWEPTNMRAGSVVLALALAALVLAPRRATWFFAICAFFSAWLGLHARPLAHWLHELPLFNIAINDRFAFAATFCAAMLAGIAVNAWPESRKRSLVAAAVVAVTAIALMIGTHALREQQFAIGVDRHLTSILTWTELLPLIAIAILFALRAQPRIALPLILGLLLVQRTIEDGGIYPALPERAFYPTIPILAHMQQDDSIFRMVGLHYAFLPAGAAMYGLEDVRGYEAMTFRRYVETYPLWCAREAVSFNKVVDLSNPFLNLLNVKYAIGSLDAKPNEQWKLVKEDRRSRLLENTRVLPRAFIPARVQYQRDIGPLFDAMVLETDFAQRAWIVEQQYEPHEIANGPGTLTIKRDGSGFDVQAVMENEGWVIFSEPAWPGWRATIDGSKVRLHFANHAFLGIFVPKGTHRVQLRYEPVTFQQGRAISLATLAACFLFLVFRRKRRGTT